MYRQKPVTAETGHGPSPGTAPPGLMMAGQKGINMNKYFYTFGSDPKFPYQNGWVEIHADSWEDAHEKFRAKFPDRHQNTLNCAFFYDEKRWAEMNPEQTWHGWKCWEIIE